MSYNHEIQKKFFLDFMMKCYFILLFYAVTEFLACHSSFNVLFFFCVLKYLQTLLIFHQSISHKWRFIS